MVEPIRDPSTEDVTRWHRTMAPQLFNRTWEILDHEDRTTEEEDEMLSAAFGQRFHWYKVGSGVNRAVADWQVARAAAVLGYGELAMRFARRSLEVCETEELAPFYSGYAHEAIARAAETMGDEATRDLHVAEARTLALAVGDEDERHMLLADLELMGL